MPVRPRQNAAPRAAGAGAPRAAIELHTLQDLRTVVGSARRHDARIRRATGISGSQLWALDEVAHAAGITVNALARRLALHQTTASNLINALAERRLIRRSRDQRDQRVVHLHVTPEGARLLARSPQPCSGLLLDALRRIGARDLNTLAHSLAVLLGTMRQAAPAAAGELLLGE